MNKMYTYSMAPGTVMAPETPSPIEIRRLSNLVKTDIEQRRVRGPLSREVLDDILGNVSEGIHSIELLRAVLRNLVHTQVIKQEDRDRTEASFQARYGMLRKSRKRRRQRKPTRRVRRSA
jgi:hypothetical protein